MPLSDEDFARRLKSGKKFEGVVVQKLIDEGIPESEIEWDPSDKVDRSRSRADFAKFDTDIKVGDKVLEVKSRGNTCNFTGVGDFPFPDIFLDSEAGWEQKKVKPDYYVVISQETGGVLAVPGDTRDQWDTRKVWDRTCGFQTKTMAAPRELAIEFGEMAKKLLTTAT
jgi:hypothetical protein